MAKVSNDTDPPKYIGEVLEWEDFMKEFDIPKKQRDELNRLKKTLYDRIMPDDALFNHITTLYHNRLPDGRWIINEEKVC